MCTRYKNIDDKFGAPKIQRSLTTHCCSCQSCVPRAFSWPCLKGHLSDLLSPANTQPSHASNVFDNASLISTWLPSPPHIWSCPELYPSWNKYGHHPADQVTWKHCAEIYEQWSNCAKGNSQFTHSGQCDNWQKDKIKWLPLYLSQTPSADTTTVCCWSMSAAAKPAVSLTNLLLQSFKAGGTGAVKVGMVLQAKRTISYQLDKHPRTEEKKQAWGIRDRFQVVTLYAPTWPGPSSSTACSEGKQWLHHLK